MHLAGVLPEDAPDPRIAVAKQLESMPIPVMGLAPQSSLEDTGSVGFGYAHGDDGYDEMTAVMSYLLWRYPQDHADPRNLAELDDETLRSIQQVPPWPRPKWLIEQVGRMRYPHLTDAVRTTWVRDPGSAPSLATRLISHVEHVLVNQFRHELELEGVPSGRQWGRIPESAVGASVAVLVDGVATPAIELDTDPQVYGVGVALPSGGLATAVIPRSRMEDVRIEFVTWTPSRSESDW